jgi:dephospho-CoA kinase
MLVALTGNSGVGASTVAGVWMNLGGNVCHLDHIGHRLMEKTRIRRAIGESSGIPGLDSLTGAESRKLLSESAFTNPTIMACVENAMHPLMKRWVGVHSEARRKESGLWVLEGALILEMGLGNLFDRVVAVVDTPERAFSRIFRRDGVSAATAGGRWSNQLSPMEKANRAHIVINNSGSLEALLKASKMVYHKLLSTEVTRG